MYDSMFLSVRLDRTSHLSYVIGGHRHAIEEELEVLYDAYYEELERYANYQQRYVSSGGTIPPPPGPGPFPGSVELDKNGAVVGHPQTKPRNPARPNRTVALTNGRKPSNFESEFDQDVDEEYDDPDADYEEEEDEDECEDDDAVDQDEDIKSQERRDVGVRGRQSVNGDNSGGRDRLFNLGSSLTVTGMHSYSFFSALFPHYLIRA